MKRELLDALAAIRNALSVIESHAEPPHMKGYAFEKQFMRECRQRGMRVSKSSKSSHVDMVVNGQRVQCKCVTPNTIGQVFIQPGQRTWYLQDDFDVLAMSCMSNLYLVPAQSLPTTNGHIRIQIRPSSMRRFIDAWEVFEGLMPVEPQQSLFGDDQHGR